MTEQENDQSHAEHHQQELDYQQQLLEDDEAYMKWNKQVIEAGNKLKGEINERTTRNIK